MSDTDVVLHTETEAVLSDHGLLISPRPTVDRVELERHLREALRVLHVDLEDENLRDTPRRWAESMVTLTSGYDFKDIQASSTDVDGKATGKKADGTQITVSIKKVDNGSQVSVDVGTLGDPSLGAAIAEKIRQKAEGK